MRIVIFTIGTQGDARPFAAFGKALVAEGHAVTIATAERHQALIEGAGVGFAPIRSDFADLMAREHATMDAGNQLRMGLKMARAITDWMPEWVRQGEQAARGAELVIASGSGTVMGLSFAEKLGVPFVQAQFMPLTPSRDIPPLWPSPRRKLPGPINLALYGAVRATMWRLQAAPTAIIRRELGLEPFPWQGPWAVPELKRERRILYAFSRHLQPQPPDWPDDSVCVTGSWFYDEAASWTPPADLAAFLDHGETPIYMGFGSMLSGDPVGFTRRVLDAVRRSGERAIVATGWGALDAETVRREGNDRILCIEGAPHDWLFPRVKLAIHHGGSGTVAAAARVGIPQIIVPFVADQFFWSWRLKAAGLTAALLDRRRLDAETLLDSIRNALSAPSRAKAQRVASAMAREDGIANAIAALRRWNMLPGAGETERAPVTPPPGNTLDAMRPAGHA